MFVVLITALGVGGATVAGSILGFLIKHISHKLCDSILAFAGGIMLAAAILGLILPAVDSGNPLDLALAVVGIFSGAIVLTLADRLIPHLHRLGAASRQGGSQAALNKALLFVAAIAIHNFPEGLAAGVSFGCDNASEALLISGGIALQNIPEGMVIIAPMLAAGISPGRTFLYALFTGLIEVAGTFLGYCAISAASAVLPFALGFAGGTMLYIISDEMIPESHADGSEMAATFSLIAGFCLMLVCDAALG